MCVFHWEIDGLWNEPNRNTAEKKILLWVLQCGIYAVNVRMIKKILTTLVKGELFESLRLYFSNMRTYL